MLEFVNGHPNASLERRDFDVSFGVKAFWSEFKYQRDTELFGEAEPADYVYQIKLGAVRAFDLLADGRRQIGAFLATLIDLHPRLSSTPRYGSQNAGAYLVKVWRRIAPRPRTC